MGSGSERHLRQTLGVFATIAGLRDNARYLSFGGALLDVQVVSEFA